MPRIKLTGFELDTNYAKVVDLTDEDLAAIKEAGYDPAEEDEVEEWVQGRFDLATADRFSFDVIEDMESSNGFQLDKVELVSDDVPLSASQYPRRHPYVLYSNAINNHGERRCYRSPLAAFEEAATYRPYSNTRISPGWCIDKHDEAAS